MYDFVPYSFLYVLLRKSNSYISLFISILFLLCYFDHMLIDEPIPQFTARNNPSFPMKNRTINFWVCSHLELVTPEIGNAVNPPLTKPKSAAWIGIVSLSVYRCLPAWLLI